MGQTLSEMSPPKPKWSQAQMPDQTGRIAIVTGGNTGIGFSTCRHLLEHNARVYLGARSAAKAKEAIQRLKDITKKQDIHFLELDLADLPSIKRAADEFMSKEQRLDMLFNSGGVMIPPKSLLTKQGYDGQFGTNTLGPGVFTVLLLPVLLATAKQTGDVRVVTTSSNGQATAPKGGINWDWIKDGPARDKAWSEWAFYGMSKWGNIVFSNEVAKRYGSQGIVSTSLNPGMIRTDLQRHMKGVVAWVIDKVLYDLEPYGAMTQLYAGTAPEAKALNGRYLIPFARPGNARKDTADPEQARKLWGLIEQEASKL